MLLVAGLVCACATNVAQSAPITIGFDGIDASAGDVPLDGTFAGVTLRNFTAYTSVPGFEGFNNGIVSGPNAAYSGGEVSVSGPTAITGSITSSKLFDFVGGYFGSGFYDKLSLTVKGLRGGSVVFSETLTLNTSVALFHPFAFIGIDALNFVAAATAQSSDPFACGPFNCTQFTMDDLRLNLSDVETPPNDVPEPGSLALVLMGAAALRAAGQRRRTTSS
jgi:hypothetical protein